MSQPFQAGDNLVFQLESAFGVVRVLAIDGEGPQTVWHLLVYEEFFPTVEDAERAIAAPDSLRIAKSHLALTDRAFERTPTARIGHHELNEAELAAVRRWQESEVKEVLDRSVLQLLGMR